MLIFIQALATTISGVSFLAGQFNSYFKGFQMNMNKMKTSAQQGFTLIELMIVVAIIGILAAIAIPQYTKYIARAESSTGLQAIAALKTGVEDHFAATSSIPTLANLGTTAAASPLGTIGTSLIAAGTGALTFTFGTQSSPKVTGKVHTLTRDVNGTWVCTSTADAEYKPKGCA